MILDVIGGGAGNLDVADGATDIRVFVDDELVKRLLEDEEINSLSSLYRDSKRRKLDHSKYESLNETPASITAQKPLENFNSSSSTVASEQMTQCSICQQSMSTSQYIEHIQIVHGTENGTGTSDGGNKLRNVRSFFPILWRILHLKIGNLW